MNLPTKIGESITDKDETGPCDPVGDATGIPIAVPHFSHSNQLINAMQDLSHVENILLNLFSGLEPKRLTESEVEALKEEYGENWFEEIGYDEEKHEKPEF